jgi:hypothetical protein
MSNAICQQHLPRNHAVPAFFRIRDEVRHEYVACVASRAA